MKILHLECNCHPEGSANGNTCNKYSGRCECNDGWIGKSCDLSK